MRGVHIGPAQKLVSVIVPTLNEIGNIEVLLSALVAQCDPRTAMEILVADGGSTDGTVERVRAWKGDACIRVVPGGGKRGLAGDVLAAAREAAGEIIVVLDADLSHPPERISDLVQPIIDGTSDMVVGSRYVPGGATPDWPMSRRLLSRLGGALAWPLTEVRDPMSGFFAVRKERLLAVDPQAVGFKIGLEIIAEGGDRLRLSEVPIVFRDRIRGESKIGLGQMLAYARRLLVLAGGAVSLGNATRFAGVGLIGFAVDLLVFQVLFGAGLGLMAAHVASFVVATISNYLLNSRWVFAHDRGARREQDWRRYSRFMTICLLAFALRGGVLAGAVELLGWPPPAAILLGVGAAAVVNYLGTAFFVFPSLRPGVPLDIRWRVAAIGVLGYVLALRLVFLGIVDLLPEEAYYWNYAQHLDIGYLDHPPMIAWLIWLGTSLFGDTEFGVRIGAYVVWIATAFFAFRLTRNLAGKSAAFVSVLLVGTLPFFFSTGLLMMPDAPLTAAWAGALYFLERALVAERRRAWWGIGICAGLGMLSKYTIALLGPATLVFLVLDPRARRWLLRPEPYLSVVLGVLLFSPVIVWNALNEWASFAFQSSRRLQGSVEFSLPMLVVWAAVLLTPWGLLSAFVAFLSRARLTREAEEVRDCVRKHRFIAIYTLLPLSVFVAFSLFHSTKLNWTGPVWLALLPAISALIVATPGKTSRFRELIRRLWVPTITVTLVIYGLGLHYLVLGFPGGGFVGSLRSLPVAWEEFGREVRAIEREIEQATDTESLLIGMDKYFLASQLAFYAHKDHDGVPNSVGRGVLGKDSLMYDFWFKPEAMRGRTAILISLKPWDIEETWLGSRFVRLGEIAERDVVKDGKLAGRFFYRAGYDLQPLP
ncbi:glycosyltransferase family 39 protein [Ancylobacter sp. VNQ12]|uniref:glycosyltransferase family 39 protein n=1 Tax=Ancylobacter sp. VNQ12 TaxID=3400920 RepID=UPI003C062264